MDTITTARTDAEVDALLASREREGFAALDLFARQYSAAVIRELRDSVHELLYRGEVEPKAAVDALGRFTDFLDACDGDAFNAERARQKMTNSSLADELYQSIGHTLALLVQHGKLTAWC